MWATRIGGLGMVESVVTTLGQEELLGGWLRGRAPRLDHEGF